MHHFPSGVSRNRDTQPAEVEALSANGWQPFETFHQVLPPSPQMRKKLTCRSSSWYQSKSCGRTATLRLHCGQRGEEFPHHTQIRQQSQDSSGLSWTVQISTGYLEAVVEKARMRSRDGRTPLATDSHISREHIAASAAVDRRVGTVNVNASLYHITNDSTFILFISILADRSFLSVEGSS